MTEGRDSDDGRLPARDRRGDGKPARREDSSSPRRDDESPARDDTRPSTRGEGGSPSRRERAAPDRSSSGATSLAAAVEQLATRPATVEARDLTATLVGVPRVDLAEFVYDHQVDPGEEGRTRPVALFDLENTGNSPLRWRDARTSFVGDDDYTYQPAHVSLDPAALGPGCHTRQVEIEPGRRARVVTLVEELPAGVEVAEVVHTLTRRRGEDERLVFAVE
jgi:hypothetical protein